MALDQSALLEVLDALKAADVGDRVRQAAETCGCRKLCTSHATC
jgi:hypothetical protein